MKDAYFYTYEPLFIVEAMREHSLSVRVLRRQDGICNLYCYGVKTFHAGAYCVTVYCAVLCCDVLRCAVYSQYSRWQQYITVSCLSENILVRCFIHRDFIRIIITMIIRIMLIIIRMRMRIYIYIYKVKWDGKNEVIPSTSHSRDKYHRTENIYSSENMLLPERWYHKSSTTTNSSILAYLRMFAAVCSHALL